jgi:hypothetical protein
MAISCEVNVGRGAHSPYVMERGLVGDRAYALIDQKTGKVGSIMQLSVKKIKYSLSAPNSYWKK